MSGWAEAALASSASSRAVSTSRPAWAISGAAARGAGVEDGASKTGAGMASRSVNSGAAVDADSGRLEISSVSTGVSAISVSSRTRSSDRSKGWTSASCFAFKPGRSRSRPRVAGEAAGAGWPAVLGASSNSGTVPRSSSRAVGASWTGAVFRDSKRSSRSARSLSRLDAPRSMDASPWPAPDAGWEPNRASMSRSLPRSAPWAGGASSRSRSSSSRSRIASSSSAAGGAGFASTGAPSSTISVSSMISSAGLERVVMA